MKVDKSERARARRELKAWIALKREQLNAAIRQLRDELKRQIAAKREQLKRRATSAAKAPAKRAAKKFPTRAEHFERELKKLKPGTQPYWDAQKQLSDARFNEAYRARKNAPTLPGSGYAYDDGFKARMAAAKKKAAKKTPAKRRAAPKKKARRAAKKRRR